jgi:tetratricopeptide (TPR) repeat protein
MPLFGESTYDRARTLARAAKAESRRQYRKAIAEYRKVVTHEPDNFGALAKLALLLAKTKQRDEALQKFVMCAEHHVKQGFHDKALAVYRQAATFLPRHGELWVQIARLQVKRGYTADAIQDLRQGRRHLRGRKHRPQAIQLLREVLKIEPWHFDATLDLARLIHRDGEKAEARRLCEGLCQRKRGRQRRLAHAALFRLSPSPGTAWRWFQSVISG